MWSRPLCRVFLYGCHEVITMLPPGAHQLGSTFSVFRGISSATNGGLILGNGGL